MSENSFIDQELTVDFEADSTLDVQVGSVYQGASIDDNIISTKKTWSSQKINNELGTKADDSATTAALALKANSADVYTKTQTYTKAEVDAAMPSDASDIDFDDSNVTFIAGTVQGAFEHITKSLTWAEYQALSTAEKNNGTAYFITDLGYPASDITYDNTNSSLVATNAQAAIDEINSKIPAVPDHYDADDIVYDNTTSELVATDVQSAIDELVSSINALTNLGLNYTLVTIQSAEYTESTLPAGS